MNTEAIDEIKRPRAAKADETPMTRRDAAEFLTNNGYRISHGTLSKLCSPAINEGPVSCGIFGRDRMYYPSVLLAWAKARMEKRKSAATG